MKKTVIALLMAAMFVGAAPAAFASEAELDSHLVVHYDFEGATLEEQLSDKAESGTTKENLQLFTTKDESGKERSCIKDGTAHIDCAEENYLACIFDSEKGSGKDIREAGSELTVYASYKMSGVPTAFADIIDVGNVLRTYQEVPKDEKKLTSKVGVRISTDAYNSGKHAIRISDEDKVYIGTDTVCYAATLRYDREAKQVDVEVRVSFDGGKNYSLNKQTFKEIETFYENCTNIALGKNLTGNMTGKNRGTSFDFYDVRIYDKALNEEEILSINGFDPIPTDPVTTETEKTETEQPRPDTAPEPGPSGTESGTDADETAKEKKGCGSTVGISGVLSAALLSGLYPLFRKKKR